ncbi:hypothetical protein HJFPF1_06481 [Paramyrothecium foliicola]|nr:hypothetical protein HJFPF1_06481 [Paramyrothecium foliicola]
MAKRRASAKQMGIGTPSQVSELTIKNSAAVPYDLDNINQAQNCEEPTERSPTAPSSRGSSSSSIEAISEEVFAIIEHAVETNIAAATGPLRLGVNRLNQSLRSFQFENIDLKEQNDTLSRQLDLHYRTIEQNAETFSEHTKALDRMFEPQSRNIQATTENLTMIAGLVSHLSQVVMNLPLAINQVVHAAVHHHAEAAIRDVMDAQQEAMLAVQLRARQANMVVPSGQFSSSSSDELQPPPPSPCWSDTFKMGVKSAKKRSPSKNRVMATPERHAATRASNMDGSPLSSKTPTTPRDTTYSHRLPTGTQRQANGRHTGRSLIMWTRPRMTDKLLLHIQYECARHKIQLPWDAIAHRLHPGSSGTAVVQHLARVRRDLISGGHLVPPLAGKSNVAGSFGDPEIRGFVRQDMHGDDRETTRAVTFSESMDDPKYELPDSFHNTEARPAVETGDFDMSDSGNDLTRSPTVHLRASQMQPKNLFSKDGIDMRYDSSMLDHVIPIDDDVFTSPRARRDHQSFTTSTGDSSENEGGPQHQQRLRPGFNDLRDACTGMIPIFVSPYGLGAPTGYIPLHLGYPSFGQPHVPLVPVPDTMSQWQTAEARIPSTVDNLPNESQLSHVSIETSEATETCIEDLVVHQLSSEHCAETRDLSASCEEVDDAKVSPEC